METTIPKILAARKRIISLSEGRRHIAMGSVLLNGTTIKEAGLIEITVGDVITHSKEEIVVTPELLSLLSEDKNERV